MLCRGILWLLLLLWQRRVQRLGVGSGLRVLVWTPALRWLRMNRLQSIPAHWRRRLRAMLLLLLLL